MPIRIPDDLPARKTLEDEGVLLIREHEALRQDVRPMQIALLNLMPEKIKTETQLARVIASTPLQVELTLLTTESYTPRNTSQEHMLAFYRPWRQVADRTFDGLIVTGAPIEEIPFEEVRYWDELTEIFDWARTNVLRSYNICWGAQAALYHYHGVPKRDLPRKLSGIYRHRVMAPNTPLMRGFNTQFDVPVSRFTETRRADIEAVSGLRVLAASDAAGLCMVEDTALGQVHVFNHFEYDTGTLAEEYARDLKAGRDIAAPESYFPGDDPARAPLNTWRCHGHLLFGNWINEIFQETPFDISRIGRDREPTESAA
jgi:homoserine O-succinyltransferase